MAIKLDQQANQLWQVPEITRQITSAILFGVGGINHAWVTRYLAAMALAGEYASVHGAGRLSGDPVHVAAVRRGDGRRFRIRSVEGLTCSIIECVQN